jgi:transposase InsO family protein
MGQEDKAKETPSIKYTRISLRNKQIDHPNQVWCSDITYIPMRKGFVYLVAIKDWYSGGKFYLGDCHIPWMLIFALMLCILFSLFYNFSYYNL